MPILKEFQSTPLRKGRQTGRKLRDSDAPVSIHAPAKGATQQLPSLMVPLLCFNPRPCERGDKPLARPASRSSRFQSTPLRKGRPDAGLPCRQMPVSIHAPAKGATCCFSCMFPEFVVSIHAPAKGATIFRTFVQQQQVVSIHAPAKGATHVDLHQRYTRRFQSTPLRKGRPMWRDIHWQGTTVSIHAPAKGATLHKATQRDNLDGFNPRPCERGDPRKSASFGWCAWFQSTPLRKGRHGKRNHSILSFGFQSTPLRKGRPSASSQDTDNPCVSIHAPAKGATLWRPLYLQYFRCFNPRPCERGDEFFINFTNFTRCFNPRPCERGDLR